MCPHCNATVPDTALFCDQCGNAVRVEPGFPRFVDTGSQFATSAAGQAVQATQLLAQAKSAFGALLVVGVLTGLGAAVLYGIGANANPPLPGEPDLRTFKTMGLVAGVLAMIFIACAFWARRQPLPAAITGLTIYVTIELAAAIQNPISILQGIILKVIIILILVRAVKAGLMHRRLAARMEAGDRERTM